MLVGDLESLADNHRLERELESLGYRTITIQDSYSLIQFLKQNDQPDLVVVGSQVPNENALQKNQALRIFGIGSLQKSRQEFLVNQSNMTCWFSDSLDESALAMRLQV